MEKHSNNLNKSVASNLSNGVLSAAPSNIPLIPHLPSAAPAAAVAMPVLPQQMITAGTRKDCIRLRGLPYEAQVEHILEFLGDHAKSIIYQGVHMVYNAQVRHLKDLELCCSLHGLESRSQTKTAVKEMFA